MYSALWISKTGMEAQQTAMDVVSNNLANANTTGFKRGRAVFQDLLYQTLRQPGGLSSEQTELPSGLQLGTGVRPVATERMFDQGSLSQTNNNLDIAIQGSGFFQVLMPDGTTAYTRDGSFQTNNQGQLVTASGYPLQPAITIPAGTQSVTIGNDGTVSITQQGTVATTQVGTIQLATFINNPGLESKGDNLYAQTAASGSASTNTPGTNGAGTLSQGFVETSNVNVVEEMVNMIQTQNVYQLNSKAVTTIDQMLQTLSQI
ncbi:MAG: flagellar basal-body rod protein FlgG [Burkholderiales bacterium]